MCAHGTPREPGQRRAVRRAATAQHARDRAWGGHTRVLAAQPERECGALPGLDRPVRGNNRHRAQLPSPGDPFADAVTHSGVQTRYTMPWNVPRAGGQSPRQAAPVVLAQVARHQPVLFPADVCFTTVARPTGRARGPVRAAARRGIGQRRTARCGTPDWRPGCRSRGRRPQPGRRNSARGLRRVGRTGTGRQGRRTRWRSLRVEIHVERLVRCLRRPEPVHVPPVRVRPCDAAGAARV